MAAIDNHGGLALNSRLAIWARLYGEPTIPNRPQCSDYFAVVVNELPWKGWDLPVSGVCINYSYQLQGWKMFLGRKRMGEALHARVPKVFS